MSARCFVDTNILVYAHDRSAGHKHQKAMALVENLWNSRLGVLSTQVLQELCISLRKKAGHPLTVEEIRGLIQDYSSWEIVVNTAESVLQALNIETRFKLSFWDSLILQLAISAGTTILYSEDMNDGQFYDSIRVVNPLSNFASKWPHED